MPVLIPLPGRDCGGCTACCVDLAIDSPELKKPDASECKHMIAGVGCGVFENRPSLCRRWYCGWRLVALSDDMRPDRSGVLLTPEMGAQPGYQTGGLRIVLTRGDRSALRQDELLDFVARCVGGAVPIWLSWGDGAAAKRYLVNEDLKRALGAGDKPAFYRVLAEALNRLIANVETSAASGSTPAA